MNTALLSNINWLAVLVAALAYFILGALWYSRLLFAPKWASLLGIDMSNPDKGKGMAGMMIGSFVLMVIACIGLALLVTRMDLFVLASGIKLGLITGICFCATSTAVNFIYERRPLGLYFINCGYHLVGNVIAAIILVMWR